jgi:drug/metabolite transporter (DMT)-like permease
LSLRDPLLLLVCVSAMVAAQTLWKIGVSRTGGIDLTSGRALSQVLRVGRSWQFLLGALVFGFATVLWLHLLSSMELSKLYPMMSLTYPIAFFSGWILLGERPSARRFAGILVICVGIFIVAQSA